MLVTKLRLNIPDYSNPDEPGSDLSIEASDSENFVDLYDIENALIGRFALKDLEKIIKVFCK
jgi:hypothetical protein